MAYFLLTLRQLALYSMDMGKNNTPTGEKSMTMQELQQAATEFRAALVRATDAGLLESLLGDFHPDHINTTCDTVLAMTKLHPDHLG